MKRLAPYAVFACACWLLAAVLPAPPAQKQDAAEAARAAGVRVLGATRGYAGTALWLRAGDAYRRGDMYETLAAYQLIQEFQPRNPAVYSYLAWNEAYNLSAQFPEPERRLEWVQRGFATLHRGQQRLSRDAGLRLDEWHFVLNRSAGYPLGVLELELERHGTQDPAWGLLARRALEMHRALPENERATLQRFLDEVGLQVPLFDTAERAQELSPAQRARLLDPAFEVLTPAQQGELAAEFNDLERMQLRALELLSPDARAVLALCHWCRFHLMVLVLAPAGKLTPRSLSVDAALLNTYRLAQLWLVPGTETEFTPRYRQGVAVAFADGIENARRYGDETAAEFSAHMRENFADLPGWLPE
ncbi:MAG: hypothetical protein IT463_01620 [Planctomycetes bacterium]|nr:hypothetical protein [Planctomycetota bacterium]